MGVAHRAESVKSVSVAARVTEATLLRTSYCWMSWDLESLKSTGVRQAVRLGTLEKQTSLTENVAITKHLQVLWLGANKLNWILENLAKHQSEETNYLPRPKVRYERDEGSRVPRPRARLEEKACSSGGKRWKAGSLDVLSVRVRSPLHISAYSSHL